MCLLAQQQKRLYSSKPVHKSFNIKPTPIFTLKQLDNEKYISSFKEMLKGKGGIYSFHREYPNTIDGKQYSTHTGQAKYPYDLNPFFITGFC